MISKESKQLAEEIEKAKRIIAAEAYMRGVVFAKYPAKRDAKMAEMKFVEELLKRLQKRLLRETEEGGGSQS
jgi:hypothetical protein